SFDHTGRYVIAIEPLAAAGVGWRKGKPVGSEQQSPEESRGILATCVSGPFAGAVLQDGVDPVPEIAANDGLVLARIPRPLVHHVANVGPVVQQNVEVPPVDRTLSFGLHSLRRQGSR